MNRTFYKIIALILAAVCFAALFSGCSYNRNDVPPPPDLTAQPDIADPGEPVKYKLSGALSSHMIVQREQLITIWGSEGTPGGILYGEFMNEKRYAVINEDGTWEMQFSSHKATTEPQVMRIYPTNGIMTELQDILVGDVWMVSGQSNAELNLGRTVDHNQEIINQIDPSDNIRLYYQSIYDYGGEINLVNAPLTDVISPDYCWERSTSVAADKFSAIGYYFAKNVSQHTDVPIGVIMTAAGGYALRHFMTIELATELGYETGGKIVDTLIAPVMKLPIKGMLFYQGENDNWNADTYAEHLKCFVNMMRDFYGYDFPFYNVQLSSHAGKAMYEWPGLFDLRCAQLAAAQLIPNYYLVASYDVGALSDSDPDVYHPTNKKPVGDRLAALALAQYYDRGSNTISASACPVPTSVEWQEDYAIVKFDYIGSGLKSGNGSSAVAGFSILNAQKKIIAYCKAEITGQNTVKVTLRENVKDQMAGIGYAADFVATPDSNDLMNSNNMPAVSFAFMK